MHLSIRNTMIRFASIIFVRRSAIVSTTFLLYANSAEHQLYRERASPSDAIACAVFVDRYLRPRRLDAIRIENFATKNDDLSRNNVGDSIMIAQKKVMQNEPFFRKSRHFFILIANDRFVFNIKRMT